MRGHWCRVTNQKGQAQLWEPKSTWQYGFRMHAQPRHLTGSYCRATKPGSGRSGVAITASGTTCAAGQLCYRCIADRLRSTLPDKVDTMMYAQLQCQQVFSLT